MKVLHLNYSDIRGGAAIAMNRLHQSLLENNINSQVLVFEKKLKKKDIICDTNYFENKKNYIKRKISFQFTKYQKINSKVTHSLNIFDSNIKKKIFKINPDILHLHWINNEFISIKQIAEIGSAGIPIVWTMHDMWPYCGAEHYTFEKRFIDGYKKSNKSKENYGIDLNKYIWNLKYSNWQDIKMNIICPTKWQFKNVKKSKIFRYKKISSIPLGINPKKFKLVSKNYAKKKLNLNNKYQYLLFGSAEGPLNDRKGLDFLKNLINKFDLNERKIAMLFFGQNRPKLYDEINIPCINLKKIAENDYEKLNLVFSASELTLIPSKIESFGLIALESLTCGTPVVTFKNIGTSDLIVHKKNGFLSKYLNIENFYNGIKWYLSLNFKNKKKISEFSRKHIQKKYNISAISKKHINLYKKIKNDF